MQLLSSTALVLVSVALCASGTSALSFSGATVTLGNVSYFVPPVPAARLVLGRSGESVSLQKSGQSLVPFTFVTPSSGRSFTSGDLAAVSKQNGAADDVWSAEFLQGVYVSSKTIPKLSGDKTEFVLSSSRTPVKPSLPSGPYFVDPSTGEVFEAWRLYNDENQSFLYGTIPDGDGGYKQLSAHVNGPATESIAVPSRLYFTATPEKPLAGKRLAVKDIYDVKGLRTGCGSRAYYHLYPGKNATAPAVQRLIDGGAVLVGKVKTSQFANGETATADWVDYHAPYNPRGDGYQDGSSSSTGSGTAVAAYPWLDYAIGSDTGGSMRGPAGANGVFGNRPSHGAVTLDDVMPLSPALDTAGIFARDAKAWKAAGDWWYQNYTQYDKYPKKILFPVDLWGSSFLSSPPENGTAAALFNTFITKLEGFLNTSRMEFNMTEHWASSSPLLANSSTPPPSLREMLNTTYADLITLDQIELLADPFIADYQAAFNGRTPFINPAPSSRWAYGRTLDRETRKAEAIANKTVFMDWFQDKVLEGKNDETCANSIMLYPQSQARTNYRNQYNALPGPPMGFSAGRIAVHGEVPDMVVPIGELPYNSTITMTTEYLPVTVSFITQKGCDLMLFSLIAGLQDAGIVSPVSTGSRLYSS